MIIRPPSDIDRAGGLQGLVEAERADFRDAPWMHAFAPNAIAELSLPLEDEYTSASFRHPGGERRSSKAATDNNQVITHRTLMKTRRSLCRRSADDHDL